MRILAAIFVVFLAIACGTPSTPAAKPAPSASASAKKVGYRASCLVFTEGPQAGCCNGLNTVVMCSAPNQPVSSICPGGQVCTWVGASNAYSCAAGPQIADPSGLNPLACEP